MIPKVARRGHSFKGAGLYYLHDKANNNGERVSTSDRVAWTYVHNMPTDDPEKAMRYMAYTSMNADHLKEQAGGSRAGRKSTKGSVYSFSLAWHTNETPEEDHMRNISLDALDRLGLKDNHQAVIVAHQETDHDHVHVICNLVNMETGKIASVSNDRLILSKWAQEYELEHGVYCEQRIKNNEQRAKHSKDKDHHKEGQGEYRSDDTKAKPETDIVKHREKKIDKVQIQELYQQSDSAEAFQAALQDNGYELAKGDRRGLVLVDNVTGKVHSLSRQLKGLWQKDKETGKWRGGLEDRFSDFDANDLMSVEEVRKANTYDREQENIDRHNRELDAADLAAKEKAKQIEKSTQQRSDDKNKDGLKEKNTKKQTQRDALKNKSDREVLLPPPAYKKLDRQQKRQRDIDYELAQIEKMLDKSHNVSAHEKRIQALQDKLSKTKRVDLFGRERKAYNRLKEQIALAQKGLDDIAQRRAEYLSIKRKQIEEKYPDPDQQKTVNDQPIIDLETEKQKRIEEIKARQLKEVNRREDKRSRDDGYGLDRG